MLATDLIRRILAYEHTYIAENTEAFQDSAFARCIKKDGDKATYCVLTAYINMIQHPDKDDLAFLWVGERVHTSNAGDVTIPGFDGKVFSWPEVVEFLEIALDNAEQANKEYREFRNN